MFVSKIMLHWVGFWFLVLVLGGVFVFWLNLSLLYMNKEVIQEDNHLKLFFYCHNSTLCTIMKTLKYNRA